MRYRVCVLPDHPDVQEKTGDINFMNKLALHQDTKLNRFKQNNALEGIISNAAENYSTGQGSADYFTSLRLLSGFSEAVLFQIQGRPFSNTGPPIFSRSIFRQFGPSVGRSRLQPIAI